MELKKKELKALIAFADEGDRPNGCTAYGPKFNAVMEAARDVRARAALTGHFDAPDKGISRKP